MQRRRTILIIADGTRPDVLGELIAAGELPAIAEAFPEPAMRRPAVSVFPSTTGPAFLPFLTGLYPGDLNMPGIRWFDRQAWAERSGDPPFRSYVGIESFRMNADFRRDVPTLFDILPDSASIFSSVNRGVPFRGNMTGLSRAWWWLFAHWTDRWDVVGVRARARLLASLEMDPEFVFCLIPDVDNYSHLSHCRSERAIAAYRRLDQTIGELFRELERRRWREDTLVVMVADHGHSAVHTHLGLPEWMAERGFRPFYYPRIWNRSFDSAVMVSGNGMAHIHLRRGGTWTAGPVPDEEVVRDFGALLGALLERREIGIIATKRSDGAVVVRSRSGTGVVTPLGEGHFQYSTQGGDPFGYRGLEGVWNSDDLLEETLATRYPDGPVQLEQLFHSPRTGDIVVSAEVGFDLRDKHENPEHFSGHGALHADHMVVPWFSTAPLPDVPLRTVDVFPTILHWMGKPIPPGVAGKDRLAPAVEPEQAEMTGARTVGASAF
ncbi:MAG TPA: alkaline phosphatase family protein [Candidatus Latescibacteria bacterium]|nr:alkaline phosphatase family protein [Candidatus Latescibacterota bacterium]